MTIERRRPHAPRRRAIPSRRGRRHPAGVWSSMDRVREVGRQSIWRTDDDSARVLTSRAWLDAMGSIALESFVFPVVEDWGES